MNTPAAVQPAFLPGIRPDILIVEDDEMVQAFLALHLENEGYGVRSAHNGAEMLSALSEGTPDLIILDLNLPDGDGLSLARQIRQHSSVPIIVATARKGHDDRMMALGLSADDYLTKPFDPKELILRIRNLLNRAVPKTAADDPPTPSSPPAQTPEPLPLLQPGPQSMTEYGAPKEAKPRTLKGLLFLVPVLAITGVAIALFGPFTEQAPISSPGPSPVQAAVETNPVQEAVETNPAADVTIAATGTGAASPSAPVPAPAAPVSTTAVDEEDLIRPISEVLGYGWVLNSQCVKVPGVKWWKYKSHESIAGYVTRKHGGDWAPYKKTWLRRLVKLQDILERDSSAVTRTGVILKGDALARYVGQMQKRLAVIHCLAGEGKAFAAAKQ
jgi:CheY-like chemotaxis protein